MSSQQKRELAWAKAAEVAVPSRPATNEDRESGFRPIAAPPRDGRDTLVLLWYEGSGQYSLEQVTVARGSSAVAVARARLPETYKTYSGPAAVSPGKCILLGQAEPPAGEYQALTYNISGSTVTPLGKPARPLSEWEWSYYLVGYSRAAGTALVSRAAPEAMADPGLLWDPGGAGWRELTHAYPDLPLPKGIAPQAACYSPDGSVLAVALARGILVYDLKRRTSKTYKGPKQYVWSLCISADNSELCWTDTGYPRRVSTLLRDEPEAKLDKYMDAGFGIISLRTGESRYQRLSQQKNLPRSMLGWPPPEQGRAVCAFSPGGTRLYFLSSGLVCLERSSGLWWTIASADDKSLFGFAVMPRRK